MAELGIKAPSTEREEAIKGQMQSENGPGVNISNSNQNEQMQVNDSEEMPNF